MMKKMVKALACAGLLAGSSMAMASPEVLSDDALDTASAGGVFNSSVPSGSYAWAYSSAFSGVGTRYIIDSSYSAESGSTGRLDTSLNLQMQLAYPY